MTDRAVDFAALKRGDRRALARAITLVESTRSDHQSAAQALLNRALQVNTQATLRIAITGVPGVGKSTFIDGFGEYLIAQGHRLAVLAVDPSSSLNGGSILGDKTRMTALSNNPKAFIRPSPTAQTLGGVARRTREAISLCEAAGYDMILIETVGVGQSETMVADMSDIFCLLLQPGSGDDLQGIKRGIMELADLLVVNKADGDLLSAARHSIADLRQALSILRRQSAAEQVPIVACSALELQGLDDIYQALIKQQQAMQASGKLQKKRKQQAQCWFDNELQHRLLQQYLQSPGVSDRLNELRSMLDNGQLTVKEALDSALECTINQ